MFESSNFTRYSIV